MFRVLSALFVVGLLLALVGSPAVAKEDKEETLKGTITCAKCDLKVEGQTKCHTVIKVGDKVYWFDDVSTGKYHKMVCTEAKEGTVVGTVKKDGDKLIVTPSKVEFK